MVMAEHPGFEEGEQAVGGQVGRRMAEGSVHESPKQDNSGDTQDVLREQLLERLLLCGVEEERAADHDEYGNSPAHDTVIEVEDLPIGAGHIQFAKILGSGVNDHDSGDGDDAQNIEIPEALHGILSVGVRYHFT